MLIRALVACVVVASGIVGNAQTPPERPRALLFNPQPRTPEVICGTRVFRAAPQTDPQFVKPAPSGTFTLRTVQPRVCRDNSAAPLADLQRRLPQFLGPKR
jgi:hypothetical protein